MCIVPVSFPTKNRHRFNATPYGIPFVVIRIITRERTDPVQLTKQLMAHSFGQTVQNFNDLDVNEETVLHPGG
jgi:hypothetical protein